MASTSQLLIVPSAEIERCKRDPARVQWLIESIDPSTTNYIDLGWWPTFLRMLFERFSAPLELREFFETICAGEPNIDNSSFTCDFDVTPSIIDPDEVCAISDSFAAFDLGLVLSRLPSDLDSLNSLMRSDFDRDPVAELEAAYERLDAFFRSAKAGGCGILSWWD